MKLKANTNGYWLARTGLLLVELALIAAIFYLLLAMPAGHNRYASWGMSGTVGSAPLHRSLFLLSLCYLVCYLLTDSLVFQRLTRVDQVFGQAFNTILFFVALSCLAAWGMALPVFSVAFLVPFYLLLCVCIPLIRLGLFCLIRALHARGFNRQKVILMGSNKSLHELYATVTAPSSGMDVTGYFSDYQDTELLRDVQYLGTPSEAIKHMRERSVTQNVIYKSAVTPNDNNGPNDPSQDKPRESYMVMPYLYGLSSTRKAQIPLQAIMTLASSPEPLAFLHNRVLKRTFDLLGACILLLTAFPLVFLLVAIVSKFKYRGPVLFREQRADTRGRSYWHYSFGLSRTLSADKHHLLDGWAEIINVLFGNLSFVGLSQQEMADPVSMPSVYMPKCGIIHWRDALHQSLHGNSPSAWYRQNWSLPLDIYIILHKLTHLGAASRPA